MQGKLKRLLNTRREKLDMLRNSWEDVKGKVFLGLIKKGTRKSKRLSVRVQSITEEMKEHFVKEYLTNCYR